MFSFSVTARDTLAAVASFASSTVWSWLQVPPLIRVSWIVISFPMYFSCTVVTL
jgi:hypothetical protein